MVAWTVRSSACFGGINSVWTGVLIVVEEKVEETAGSTGPSVFSGWALVRFCSENQVFAADAGV